MCVAGAERLPGTLLESLAGTWCHTGTRAHGVGGAAPWERRGPPSPALPHVTSQERNWLLGVAPAGPRARSQDVPGGWGGGVGVCAVCVCMCTRV